MPRLTKIYTGAGDEGTTSLGSGERVPKESLRIRAYGTVDELSSLIGAALAHGLDDRLEGELPVIQNELFHLGSDLCFPESSKEEVEIPQIRAGHVDRLEAIVDELVSRIGPAENFVLPGGSIGAAQLHVARAVCRRAERVVVALSRDEPVGEHVLPYLNRLSDTLFVMARWQNRRDGVDEPVWDATT